MAAEASHTVWQLECGRHQQLPTELFRRRPGVFLIKFILALSLIAAAWTTVAVGLGILPTAVAVTVLGFMYAHMIELQHECLHHHAFRRRGLNRFFGVIAGMFLLSNYSHYRAEHLAHHARLGRPDNIEFFNYRFRDLDSVAGFFRAALHLGRYVDVSKDLARSLTGHLIPGIRERDARRIRSEYLLMAAVLATVTAFSIGVWSPLPVLVCWLLPTVLVGEPIHFLIELPEHFALDTQNMTMVQENTRTIRTNRLLGWFTNYNNLHTAHHYDYLVPMSNVPRLDALRREQWQVVEPSYRSFYRKVLRGELKYERADQTCMTR